ncbi:MAG: acetylxylan esterase [Armatimonadota bacterium]|nr:acetylxylan esterase [Armatimonadota bacterium]
MEPLNRFPRMMQEYLVARIRAVDAANRARIMALEDASQAQQYVAELQAKLPLIFGELPERTPLDSRTVGTLERDDFIVEKIIFHSRPDFPVTANLYLPREAELPAPAVIVPSGHSHEGKAAGYNQAACQILARNGFVALAYDPISQGERLQYPGGDGEDGQKVRWGTHQHNYIGNPQLLVGEFFGTWRAWDGIRAIDYLLTREEVDPSRIGVTGCSGGGTMSTLLTALERRITMSAPSCYVTSWRRDIGNELAADAEQMPPNAHALGVGQHDLLLMNAPEALILLTQEQDFFDQRGSLESYERIEQVYEVLGAQEVLDYYVGPGGHGYPPEMREAMAAHFCAAAGLEFRVGDEAFVEEPEEELWCTESGQVAERDPTWAWQMTAQRSRALAAERGEPSGEELVRRVRELLELPERDGPPDYRVLRLWAQRDHARPYASHFVLETDPEFGAQAVVTKLEDEPRHSRPLSAEAAGLDGTAVLYLPHLSSDAELREDERLRELEEQTPAFFACDYRGIGESMPDAVKPDSFHGYYGSDYFYAAHATMFGESYVAWRVHDVLCTLDWMASFGYDEVHLVARGYGAIPGALAALLHDSVTRVTLIHPLRSYAEIAERELYDWPLSALIPNVLEHFDLPDVYRALEAKKLEMVDPVGARFEEL